MLTTNKKNIKRADSLRNNLLSNTGFFQKNNIDDNKKTFENQPYNEYINLNSLMNNQISGEFTLSTTERTRCFKEENNSNEFTNDKNYSQLNIFMKQQKKNIDNSFLNSLIFGGVKIKEYRKYIYFIQKTFIKNNGNYLKHVIKNKNKNSYNNLFFAKEINQLENLIARYSIIIFFLIKHQQIDMAKSIFLLMIKENIIYIDFFEKNLYKEFSNIGKDINLINLGCPKSILTLSKIYSIILKYSLLFNLTKNRSIYLSKYLSLQNLNYNIFLLKSQLRGSSIVTDIAIKYLYANCLFNSCYYSIKSYISLIIPIKLSELIFKLYEGMNEIIFEKKEKSLLLNASYNYALYIYLNGNNESALRQLELIKEKLFEFYEYNLNDEEEEEKEDDDEEETNYGYKDVYSPTEEFSKKREAKKKLSINFQQKILIKRQETMRKLERKRALSKTQNTIDKIKEILFNKRVGIQSIYNSKNNLFDPLHQAQINILNNNFRKKTVKIEDIKKFFISDVKTALNKKNRKCSITERDIKNKQKFQKNFGVSNKNSINSSTQSIADLRTSHINFRSLFKINKLNLPKYMTNSLLIETELLMCEIYLDSKNIQNAYEHFKNSVLILFISKQNDSENDIKSIRDFRKKLRTIFVYLNEINKYIDEKNKKNTFKILKNPIKSTKTYLSLSKKNTFKEKKSDIKKSSLRLGKNRYLESIEFKMNKKDDSDNGNKGEEYYNKLVNKKMAKEIEKLFLFLNTLSIYQIKLLNDTQPKREIRNDLPILFNAQFKDSLTKGQRTSLNNLLTMSITRNMILQSPDKLILPTNLKFSVLNYKTKELRRENNVIKTNKNENHKTYDKVISFANTIEYTYFKKIIFNKKIGLTLQQFLLNNYSLVMKILRKLKKNEIEDIIDNPDILVSPINNYKKRQSKIMNNNLLNNRNNDYLLKIKDINELKKIITKLSIFQDEDENEKKEEEDEESNISNILIESDSENNKSLSLSVSISSFNS